MDLGVQLIFINFTIARCKISKFQSISWYGYFVKTHRFFQSARNPAETLQD